MYLRQNQNNFEHLNQGLGFISHQTAKPQLSGAKTEGYVTGNVVLKDFMASPEIYQIVSVTAQGMKGEMVIKLRSLQRAETITVDSIYTFRAARSNEVKAGARQGSEQFECYWQNQNQNFHY